MSERACLDEITHHCVMAEQLLQLPAELASQGDYVSPDRANVSVAAAQVHALLAIAVGLRSLAIDATETLIRAQQDE